MNRQMRRMAEREQRRQRKQEQQRGKQSPAQRAARRAGSPQEQQEPLFKRIGRYLREVQAELKRVSWPTRDQMVAYTTVTLITTIALTGYVWGIDRVFERAVVFVLSLGS